MAELLKGAPVAKRIEGGLALRIEALAAQGIRPGLAILRLGENPGDLAYEGMVARKCSRMGIPWKVIALPKDTPQERLLSEIDALNGDRSTHGILLFRPLPAHLDDPLVRGALSPEKDMDGLTGASLAGVFAGKGRGFPPCTAQACLEILDHYGVELAGKRVVVIGRSLVVGKPLAMLLLSRDATVTICHRQTPDLPSICREAEVLIVSAGRAGLVGGEFLSPGQTVIDVGINVREDGSLTGDVEAEAALRIVKALSPVPGGVGTVTASVLLKHLVTAATGC
jgi:methylenetetrahydrofolate dehydrogenase (NADP+)/methenyltetrahydrofolate cyclohydrolase